MVKGGLTDPAELSDPDSLGYFCGSAKVFLGIALRYTGDLSSPPEK